MTVGPLGAVTRASGYAEAESHWQVLTVREHGFHGDLKSDSSKILRYTRVRCLKRIGVWAYACRMLINDIQKDGEDASFLFRNIIERNSSGCP